MKLTTWVDENLAERVVATAERQRRSISNLLRTAVERIVDEDAASPTGDITHETQKLLSANPRFSRKR
jgi:hypothetical protein